MKNAVIRFMFMGLLIIGLAGCNNDENASRSHTETDDNQLPISSIQTDSSSDEAGPDTQHIRFEKDNDNNLDLGKTNRNRNENLDDNNQNQNPFSGNARDPGREQDRQLQQGQERPHPEQNQDTNGQQQNQSQQGMNEFASKVISLTNRERSRQGLSPLKVSKPLSGVARQKSEDMQEKNYFSHTSPTYGSPFNMMREFNVSFESAGENIARGQQSPQQVVDSWMNSTEHRENILDESFTHIGVGYTSDGGYWSQMFIEK
ncbi:CAP domain-containing protein [Lentibacillus jeotgali]|uniref:CAP domain-containing protein n=1 Tax=Lentibacillus jeotgali TaxID=558169 RepID=UPI0002628814|nr:CAP domain-containing protein [Lentibacillus jeotgali]